MSAARRLNRDEIMQRCKLVGCEDFVDECEEFVFDAFGYFDRVERAQGRRDMTGYRSFNNNAGKRVPRCWRSVI